MICLVLANSALSVLHLLIIYYSALLNNSYRTRPCHVIQSFTFHFPETCINVKFDRRKMSNISIIAFCNTKMYIIVMPKGVE